MLAKGQLNLIYRQDYYENTISYTYDIRGFKIAMTDPDMGTYNYEYNTLGQLITQTYPAGNTISFEYDLLNRIIQRTENEGITEWQYDPDNGVGQIKEVFLDGELEQVFVYNSEGKLQRETYVRNNQNKTFSYTYNSSGFLETETYPNEYSIRYLYNDKGFPSQLIEDETNIVLWEANEYDENGRNTQFTLGNGLRTTKIYNDITENLQSIVTGSETSPNSTQDLSFTFSPLGNLQQRSDNILDRTETFEFDELNRLTKSTILGIDTLSVTYDLLGNITFKSDVGNYVYGENGAGPHVLTSIDHAQVPNCIYNLQQNVEFTSYNYASSISNLSTRVEIDYSVGRDRKQLRTYQDGSLTTTKTYAGQSYEEVEAVDGTSTQICYLKIGSGVFAYVSKKESEPQKTTYIHTDHLGSVNVLTDENGLFLERHSFDAWGKKRDPFTWERLEIPPTIPADFSKGFTFHENLDIDWLVCMNARIYNPVLGRFLSPDPFIQFGENMQSMNRYAYVLNNPLSFTDPSGYFSFSEFFEDTFDFTKENLGAVVGIAISASLGGLDGGFFAVLLSGATAGFGAAFTDAFVAAGSFNDAFDVGLDGGLWGAISAGLSYGVGSAFYGANSLGRNVLKPVIHGVVQGGISKAIGGDFKSGFYGGSLSSFGLGIANQNGLGGNAVIGAIVGGTASQLSGGKFANGALSGAFIAIYNDNQHVLWPDHADETYRYTGYDIGTSRESASLIPLLGEVADLAGTIGEVLLFSTLSGTYSLASIATSPFAIANYFLGDTGVLDSVSQSSVGRLNRLTQIGSAGVALGDYIHDASVANKSYYDYHLNESILNLYD